MALLSFEAAAAFLFTQIFANTQTNTGTPYIYIIPGLFEVYWKGQCSSVYTKVASLLFASHRK